MPSCPIPPPACARSGSASPQPRTVFQAKSSEQYHVCLGGIGLPRSDRRRFAASLLDSMLGGSASSRLFQEIREKRGMAYSVYTFGSQYADTGMVGVYVGTREDNLAECMRDHRRSAASGSATATSPTSSCRAPRRT